MKLYTYPTAPNPRRVHLLMRCKGIEVPTEEIDLRQGRQFEPAFLGINPRGTVPVLQLDDGRVLTDSLAICWYLDRHHPGPVLTGQDAAEQAQVLDWHMRIFVDGVLACADRLRNGHPSFADHALPGPQPCPQIPALAERGEQRMHRFLQEMDAHVTDHDHLVGDRLTLADIDLLVALDFAARLLHGLPHGCANLQVWRERTSTDIGVD